MRNEGEDDKRWRLPSGLAATRDRLTSIFEVYRNGEHEHLEMKTRVWAGPLQLLLLTIREVIRDNVIQRASSLAFFSLLSIIPLLSVVTVLLGAFGLLESLDGGLASYLDVVFPATGVDVGGYFEQQLGQSSSIVGGINGVVLLVISIFLFSWIERALTDIWHGGHNRSLLAKFLMFYTMITLGPVLIILSVVQTASAQVFISERFFINTGFVDKLLPLVYAFIVFALMNKILPNVMVRWSSALLAGVVTSAAFELAKFGFNQYINTVLTTSYQNIYGALGVVPLFIVWIYVTWIVILIGSEMAYCFQNMERLLRLDDPLITSLKKVRRGENRHYDSLVSLDIMAPIVAAWTSKKGAISEERIGYISGIDTKIVSEVVTELIDAGIIMHSGKSAAGTRMLMPAGPPSEIALSEIIGRFQRRAIGATGSTYVHELRDTYIDRTCELVQGKSAHDLVDDLSMREVEEALRDDQMSEGEEIDTGHVIV